MHGRIKNKPICIKILVITCLAFCLALPSTCFAQDGPQDPNDAPVDGGLGLLIAAGTAYGIKRYRDRK